MPARFTTGPFFYCIHAAVPPCGLYHTLCWHLPFQVHFMRGEPPVQYCLVTAESFTHTAQTNSYRRDPVRNLCLRKHKTVAAIDSITWNSNFVFCTAQRQADVLLNFCASALTHLSDTNNILFELCYRQLCFATTACGDTTAQ